MFRFAVDTFEEFQTKVYANEDSYCMNHSVCNTLLPDDKRIHIDFPISWVGSGNYCLLYM